MASNISSKFQKQIICYLKRKPSFEIRLRLIEYYLLDFLRKSPTVNCVYQFEFTKVTTNGIYQPIIRGE